MHTVRIGTMEWKFDNHTNFWKEFHDKILPLFQPGLDGSVAAIAVLLSVKPSSNPAIRGEFFHFWITLTLF